MWGRAAGRGWGLVPALSESGCCTVSACHWGRKRFLYEASVWGEPLLAAEQRRPDWCFSPPRRSFAPAGSDSAPSVPGSGPTAETQSSASTWPSVRRFLTRFVKRHTGAFLGGIIYLTSFIAVWSSNTFCSLASTSSLRAWELFSSWDICSSKACRHKHIKTCKCYVTIKIKNQIAETQCEETHTWIWEPSCSIIRCCFSMTYN